MLLSPEQLARWWWKFRVQMGWVWCDRCREPRMPNAMAQGGKMVRARVWVCGRCRYAR